jgi:hypothetical protein
MSNDVTLTKDMTSWIHKIASEEIVMGKCDGGDLALPNERHQFENTLMCPTNYFVDGSLESRVIRSQDCPFANDAGQISFEWVSGIPVDHFEPDGEVTAAEVAHTLQLIEEGVFGGGVTIETQNCPSPFLSQFREETPESQARQAKHYSALRQEHLAIAQPFLSEGKRLLSRMQRAGGQPVAYSDLGRFIHLKTRTEVARQARFTDDPKKMAAKALTYAQQQSAHLVKDYIPYLQDLLDSLEGPWDNLFGRNNTQIAQVKEKIAEARLALTEYQQVRDELTAATTKTE